MSLFRYSINESPRSISFQRDTITISKWEEEIQLNVQNIESICIAYWGDQEIDFSFELKDAIPNLIKSEFGVVALLFQIKGQTEPLSLEINNSNTGVKILRTIINSYSILWKGFGTYEVICEKQGITAKWNAFNMTKKFINATLLLYGIGIALIFLNVLLNKLFL